MKTRAWIVAAIAAAHIPLAAATASAAAPTAEFLVRFAPGTGAGTRAAIHTAAGAQVLRRIDAIGYDVVRATSLAGYGGVASVISAEPNLRGTIAASGLPSDACTGAACDGLPSQWHLRRIGFSEGWRAAPPSTPSATIAVLDTKIDTSHPDWVPTGGSGPARLDLARAKDFVPSSRWSGAAAYHGTFVAGLAGAGAGNGTGTAGIGWNTTIVPITVIDGGGSTDAATLAEAMIYAWSKGARVINLSLGLTGDSPAVRDAVRHVSSGAQPSLVVAAAGNNTGSAPFYPGSYPEVLSVSGTDANDKAAPCSNHNANVSVSAPADRLVGITPQPEFARQATCGTSAAAPLVAGLAGQLFAQDPTRTPAQVRAIIEENADDLGPAGRDDAFGHGRINVGRALAAGATNGTFATGVRAGAISTTVAAPKAVTTVTARATGGVIRGAQAWVGDADTTPVEMRAADGSFGENDEAVTADVRLPSTPGPHTVWVRVWDGVRWSAATTGAAAVDSRAPQIFDPAADGAVRATGAPLVVRFSATDDLAARLAIGIEFRSSVTNAIVATVVRTDVIPGAQQFTWSAPLSAPAGHYTVKIAVADSAGNVATTQIGAIVT